MLKATARIVHNELPALIATLQAGTLLVVEQTAKFAQQAWSEDVRVSEGEGNYTGPSHYRDNIFTAEVAPGVWWVYTPVDYSRFNEYGSVTISAKPSARTAADEATVYLQGLLANLLAGGHG